jgi:hypothetical protein
MLREENETTDPAARAEENSGLDQRKRSGISTY